MSLYVPDGYSVRITFTFFFREITLFSTFRSEQAEDPQGENQLRFDNVPVQTSSTEVLTVISSDHVGVTIHLNPQSSVEAEEDEKDSAGEKTSRTLSRPRGVYQCRCRPQGTVR